MTAWRFPSNMGSEELVCTLLRIASRDPEWIECDLVASAEASDPSGAAQREGRPFERLCLSSILVSGTQLSQVEADLETWLRTGLPFQRELRDVPGQQMLLSLRADARLITSPEKPALILTYRGSGIEASFYTVVDQSCVRIAHETLRAALRSLRGA